MVTLPPGASRRHGAVTRRGNTGVGGRQLGGRERPVMPGHRSRGGSDNPDSGSRRARAPAAGSHRLSRARRWRRGAGDGYGGEVGHSCWNRRRAGQPPPIPPEGARKHAVRRGTGSNGGDVNRQRGERLTGSSTVSSSMKNIALLPGGGRLERQESADVAAGRLGAAMLGRRCGRCDRRDVDDTTVMRARSATGSASGGESRRSLGTTASTWWCASRPSALRIRGRRWPSFVRVLHPSGS